MNTVWGINTVRETCAQLKGYSLVGITETWWDGSHDLQHFGCCNGGYAGSIGETCWKEEDGGVSLDVREQLECVEICLGMDEEPTESLWVRIKEKTVKGDTVGGGKTSV